MSGRTRDATTTIRVPVQTRDRLNALAERRGGSAGDLVADLVSAADDDALLADAEQAWHALGEVDVSQIDADAKALEAFDADPPPY